MDNKGEDYNQKNSAKTQEMRDRIVNESWETLKNDKMILLEALKIDGINLNVGDFLLMERVLILSDVFEDIKPITPKLVTTIINTFANGSENINELQAQIQSVCPGLVIKKDLNLAEQRDKAKQLANGLANIKHIAMTKFAEELFSDVTAIKQLPLPTIEANISKANLLSESILNSFSKEQDPPKKQLDQAAQILKSLGRTAFEIDQIRLNENAALILELFQKAKDSLMIVQLAYKENLVNRLNEIDVIRNLLEKVKSTNK